MQKSETEHHLYVQSLKNRWKVALISGVPSQGIPLEEVHTYFFGLFKLGDLCQFECDGIPSFVGMISSMKYVVTSTHGKMHLWSSILVGEDVYIFHTRIDNSDFNDALIYTNIEANSVLDVKIIATL